MVSDKADVRKPPALSTTLAVKVKRPRRGTGVPLRDSGSAERHAGWHDPAESDQV